MSELSEYTTNDLLREILKRNKPSSAPKATKRMGLHFESVIGISDDETCYLTMHEDSLKDLTDFKCP